MGVSTQYLVGRLAEVFADRGVFQCLEVGALEGVLSVAGEDEDRTCGLCACGVMNVDNKVCFAGEAGLT